MTMTTFSTVAGVREAWLCWCLVSPYVYSDNSVEKENCSGRESHLDWVRETEYPIPDHSRCRNSKSIMAKPWSHRRREALEFSSPDLSPHSPHLETKIIPSTSYWTIKLDERNFYVHTYHIWYGHQRLGISDAGCCTRFTTVACSFVW